jgi:methylated-DNA-protein-cysteine methyltransferase-like protein
MEADTRYQRFYDTVAMIPRGSVATYGQIAALAGRPGNARQVGYSLHALPQGSDIPWQRVVNAQGRVSPRASPGWEDFQRQLLIEEGVVFNASGRIDLKRFGWEPDIRISYQTVS